MRRVLSGADAAATVALRTEAPGRMRRTTIDFSALCLPDDVSGALAEAFWSHFGVHKKDSLITRWYMLKSFARFVAESGALHSLQDINAEFLALYIEWLNRQQRANGEAWTKQTRAHAYMTLRTLLR